MKDMNSFERESGINQIDTFRQMPDSLTSRRWMIVDDNLDILPLMRDMLSELRGAEVESYASPLKALAAVTADPDQFELVVTDFEMPFMNGLELGRRMRASAPALKIFLATGGGFFREEFTRNAGFSGLLNKPFPLGKLRDALSRAGVMANAEALMTA